MSVILRSYGARLGLPDLSPFGTKMDCYLRMAEIPYTKKSGDPRKSPKGKLPILQHDGQTIADSSHIIDYLEKNLSVDLDAKLTEKQKALSTVLKSMLEEHLYFVLIYFRWQDDIAWEGGYRETIQASVKEAGVPGILLPFIVKSIRKATIKSLHAQGTGRHSREELISLGKEHLKALSVLLGEQEYFHGENPSNIDASAFAMLSGILVPKFDSPLKEYAKTLGNLDSYVLRIQERYFTETDES